MLITMCSLNVDIGSNDDNCEDTTLLRYLTPAANSCYQKSRMIKNL